MVLVLAGPVHCRRLPCRQREPSPEDGDERSLSSHVGDLAFEIGSVFDFTGRFCGHRPLSYSMLRKCRMQDCS